jgi:hypothetical protein
MRNELFYQRDKDGEWSLANDPSAPTRLLGNVMLSSAFGEETQLEITFSRYGNRTERIDMPYSHFLQCCEAEGCHPYFGLKSKDDNGYRGTLLLVNGSLGYVHLLSVVVPHTTISQRGRGSVRGTLYAYIPLHNVANHYFR